MAQIDIELSNGDKAGETLKELSKQASQLNRQIRDLKPGTQEFADKAKDLQAVSGRMSDIRTQIKGTTEASNALKEAWDKYVPFSGTFKKIGEDLGFAKKGVGGLSSSFGVLRTAIIATGIGALIVLLGSLISYFTTTQSGIDKVTAVTRPLSAIFERLKGVLQELGEKVFKKLGDAIDNPKQAFKDLGEIIVNNVLNRFKAFTLIGPAIQKIFSKDWKEGLKDLANAGLQAVTGVEKVIDKVTEGAKQVGKFFEEAWNQGKRLDELQKQIERAEINQIKRSKELELIIKQQKDIVEDVTKSWDDRRLAAEKALAAQQAQLNLELSLLDKRIEKMKLEQSLNDTSRENEKELAELEAKRFEVQAKITEQSIEFKKKINEFDKAQAAEQEAILKSIEDLRIEAMKEGMEKEIAEIELQTERKIEALIGSAEQIAEQEALLEEIRLQQIQAIRDKYAAEQAEKDKKAKEEQEKRDKELADKQKQIAQEKAEFERMLDEINRDAASESFAFATELSARRVKDEAAAKKIRKAGAIVDIGINLQKELSANRVYAATLGPIAGPIYLASSSLKAYLSAGIATARVLAFRKGGYLSGPSHEQGGIPFTIAGRPGFEAEGGEFMFSRKAVRGMGIDTLSAINNYFNRKFEAGGPVNPLRSALQPVSSIRRDTDQLFDQSPVINKLDELIASIDSRIDRLEVVNDVTKTAKGIQTINEIQADADA